MSAWRRPLRVAAGVAILVASYGWGTAASADDPRAEALAHGYQPQAAPGRTTPPAADDAGGVYLKLIEPRRLVAVLTMPSAPADPSAPFSVVTYAIDCKAKAVKFRSVETLDAQWNPKISGLPLPKTVWHRPMAGSPAGQAIRIAC